jgi:hypothetical protein
MTVLTNTSALGVYRVSGQMDDGYRVEVFWTEGVDGPGQLDRS